MAILDLFRRTPPEPEDDVDERELETPSFIRRDGEWKSGLRAVRERSLEWTSAEPRVDGFWHVRLPGATRYMVVQVAHDERGVLVYGVPKVDWKPVRGAELEWGSVRIQEPRP